MGKMVGMAEFKAKCIAILNDVQATGETVTVTKRGKPVAVVEPIAPEGERGKSSPIGFLKNDGYRFNAAGDPDDWAALT